MLALTLGSVYFLLTGRFTRGFLFFTAAFLMKYTVGLILPFLVVFAVRREWAKGGRFPIGFAVKQLAFNLAFIAAGFLPLWDGPEKTFVALTNASTWFHTNTIPYAFGQLLGILGAPAEPLFLKRLFLGAYAVVYFFLLYREATEKTFDGTRWMRRLCLVYLFFYLTVTIPFNFHYLQWALPWLILSRWPLPEFLVTVYSFTGLFSYFKRMNYLILLACPVYFGTLYWWFRVRGAKRSA